jgi:NitT/TauT family transport system ATP-binding protein
MSYLSVNSLFKTYLNKSNGREERVEVLNSVSLTANRSEFIAIFGPNGCGKTTFLNIVSGLLNANEGNVQVDGKSPGEARIGYIFQNYGDSLLPWRTTLENIKFPLELKGKSKVDQAKIVDKYLSELEVKVPLDVFPYQLSGGQQQLIAILRALVFDPDLLLMDEPFGSLDFQTRLFMQNALLNIWSKTRNTILFVSHEIDEAIYMADRIVLFSKRPAHVVEEVHVDLPRPRTNDLFGSEPFYKLKKHILEVFRKETNNI